MEKALVLRHSTYGKDSTQVFYICPKLFLSVRIRPVMGDLVTRFVEQLLSFVSHLQLWKACSKMAAVCNLYAMRLLNAGVHNNIRKLIEITHVTAYHQLCAIYASDWVVSRVTY